MNLVYRSVFVVAAALVLSFVVPSSATAASAKRHALEVDGLRRNYLLYTPRNLDRRKAHPLVLVIHGGGGTARGLYRDTRKSFTALADEHGFFVVYPNAVNRMWDFGAGKVSEALSPRIDDKAYFAALLEDLTNRLPVNRERVFATGVSRGGQASYFLACQFPDQIRAIAPITMPMPAFMAEDCRATPDIGLVLMNGTQDPVVPYDGGQIVVGRKARGRVLSTSETVASWVTRNGCSITPSDNRTIDTVSDSTAVLRTDWSDCEGAPVRLYRIDGGGHTWPSGSQYLPVRVVGEVTRDIDGAVEAWRFFSMFN